MDLVFLLGELWNLLGLRLFGFCGCGLLEIAEIIVVLLGLLGCLNHLWLGLRFLFYFFVDLDRLFFLDLWTFNENWCFFHCLRLELKLL